MFPENIDPFKFDYPPNKSVDDVVAIALHHTLQHLDCSRAYNRMLFLHYSSTFNTIWSRKLVGKLVENLAGKKVDMGVPAAPCNWVLDFLMDSPQIVRR